MWMVEFHEDAEEEAEAAVDWYAVRNVGVARAFADELKAAVVSIAEDPTRLPTLGPERFFYLLKRFPYLLVYRVSDDRVQVLAVAHVSRRPGYWKNREF